MFRYRGYSPTKKLLGLAVVSSFILLLLFVQASFNSSASLKYPWWSSTTTTTVPDGGGGESCSPQAYAQGHWSYHPRTTIENMTSPDDALVFSGFEKCASSREYYWHLASDTTAQWDRFPGAQSWEWIPGDECKGMGSLNPEDLIKTLVEDGGWYLVGGKFCQSFY